MARPVLAEMAQRRGGDLDQPVGELAEDREDHDRSEDLRRLAELLAVQQEIAEALGGADQFGRDHEHPSQAKPDPQRHHIGRQHRRQQDAADHGRPGQPEHAADLDDLAIDRQDRAHHAEIDRKEHPDRDQCDLRGLEDAEPEHEQRHPGERRDRTQGLHGRIKQPLGEIPIAGDRAHDGAGDDAERKARTDAPQGREDMPRQLAAPGEFDDGLEHL